MWNNIQIDTFVDDEYARTWELNKGSYVRPMTLYTDKEEQLHNDQALF